MKIFFIISAIFYWDDVEKLGSRHYPTRHEAHLRLLRAGRPAVPALLNGLKTDCPERQWRCEWILRAIGWEYRACILDNVIVRPLKMEIAKSFISIKKLYHERAGDIPHDPTLAAIARDEELWVMICHAAASAGFLLYYESDGYEQRYWLLWDLARSDKTRNNGGKK